MFFLQLPERLSLVDINFFVIVGFLRHATVTVLFVCLLFLACAKFLQWWFLSVITCRIS